MARAPRVDVPGVTYHGILRCNNEEWLLREPDAKQVVLELLEEAAARHALWLHAYVLMDNHVHLVLSRSPACTLAVAMHWFMTQTAKELLRLTGRAGHVWHQRYRAIVVQENAYALALLRYVDRNPVRAGLVTAPQEYTWSSCRAYALGMATPGITLHPTYLGLSEHPWRRQAKYRTLLESIPDGGDARQPAFSRVRVVGDAPFCRRFGVPPPRDLRPLAALLPAVRRLGPLNESPGSAPASHPLARRAPSSQCPAGITQRIMVDFEIVENQWVR